MALYHACANALRAIVFYVPGGYTRKFRSREKFGCERADYILRPYKIFLSVENGGTRVAYIINRGEGEREESWTNIRLCRARALMRIKK